MYDNLASTIKTINKSKKIRCFFLGNTVKKESSSFYVTAIRENQKFIYAGAIIFNNFSELTTPCENPVLYEIKSNMIKFFILFI